MKNLTVSVSDDVLAKARVIAAHEGKSMSRFVSELIQRRVGQRKTQREALEAFLAGPLMDLTDENGKAPSRDQIYDRSVR